MIDLLQCKKIYLRQLIQTKNKNKTKKQEVTYKELTKI